MNRVLAAAVVAAFFVTPLGLFGLLAAGQANPASSAEVPMTFSGGGTATVPDPCVPEFTTTFELGTAPSVTQSGDCASGINLHFVLPGAAPQEPGPPSAPGEPEAPAAPPPPGGATIAAASGSWVDLQAAVDRAVPGDRVTIPAGTWTVGATVAVPGGIALRGAGAAATILVQGDFNGPLIEVENAPGHAFELSGIALRGAGGEKNDIGLRLLGAQRDFRIFDSLFEQWGRAAISFGASSGAHRGNPHGVIFGNSFVDNVTSEGGLGYGVAVSGDPLLADEPLTLGTAEAVYIEDNFFKNNRHAVTSNNGSRYVFRRNVVEGGRANAAFIDAHGLQYWPRGSRSYEIYDNTITSPDKTWWAGIGLRGGDGVIFGNTIEGTWNAIVLMVDDLDAGEAYPLRDQIRDLWIWDNNWRGNPVTSVFRFTHSVPFLQAGRDYHFAPKPGYTPLVYPHPLRSE